MVQLRDGTHIYADQLPQTSQQQGQPPVVHIHEAPPDRTTQRIALGTGIGAGTVAAGVYFGPLLVAALTSIAISLAVVALLVVVVVWGLSSASKTIRDNNRDTRRYRRR
ncbi:hypothetical protein SM8_015610 [Streptomyces sp. SM8]|nr:hypothetical protein SM8_015610 [Streptomyces sp. SM8]